MIDKHHAPPGLIAIKPVLLDRCYGCAALHSAGFFADRLVCQSAPCTRDSRNDGHDAIFTPPANARVSRAAEQW